MLLLGWARPRASFIAITFSAVCGGGEMVPPRRCVTIDVFAVQQDESMKVALDGVRAFATAHDGVVVVHRAPDVSDADREQLRRIAARSGFDPAHLPVVSVCDVAIVRPPDVRTTIARLKEALAVTVFTREGCPRCIRAKAWLAGLVDRYPAFAISTADIGQDGGARKLLADLVRRQPVAAASVPVLSFGGRLEVGFDRAETTGRRLEAILEGWTAPCPASPGGSDGDLPPTPASPIDLPFWGPADPATLGMPLFTVVVGLVDGFNPCAMWVLLLLLAVLANVRDRVRMLAVAGTFVIVSGVAYLAFMAAWLNVFMWIGYLRPIQVVLGLAAICIGSMHIKDFFMFETGLTLSIPASAKPGIYEWIRRIVSVEDLPTAVASAFVLAVLVNVVELLCTAGLPALYAEILSQRDYSLATRYGYLSLYIAAYMLDDLVMICVAVTTLSRFRLQQSGGRWLKLISGVAVVGLGLLLLLKPEWLA